LFDSGGDSCKSEPSLMVKTTAREESLCLQMRQDLGYWK
jgi:hypothetical protein